MLHHTLKLMFLKWVGANKNENIAEKGENE